MTVAECCSSRAWWLARGKEQQPTTRANETNNKLYREGMSKRERERNEERNREKEKPRKEETRSTTIYFVHCGAFLDVSERQSRFLSLLLRLHEQITSHQGEKREDVDGEQPSAAPTNDSTCTTTTTTAAIISCFERQKISYTQSVRLPFVRSHVTVVSLSLSALREVAARYTLCNG